MLGLAASFLELYRGFDRFKGSTGRYFNSPLRSSTTLSRVNHCRIVGVGVGDASASATAAVLLSIVQESMGRVATILFAHRFGTSLEPECKMYRLLADFFNDAAMILDCLSPAFPKPLRVVLLSCSSALRALCGVAAGSAKASLSAHFARWGNLGELNAVSSTRRKYCMTAHISAERLFARNHHIAPGNAGK